MRLHDYHGNLRITPKRIISKLRRELEIAALTIRLEVNNRMSSKPIEGNLECVVSLTTHGERIKRVHLSIESIARGTRTPHRIILWVDPGVDIDALPPNVQRLRRRGLEVRSSMGNYGPHTKYYPYVASVEGEHDVSLVTADDDILYPRRWLELLASVAHEGGNGSIVCYRAHRVELLGNAIAPYGTWKPVEGIHFSPRNFATGVSGVWYPPKMLNSLRSAGTAFQESCPRADDIWLHVIAVRNRIPVRQVLPDAKFFYVASGSQKINLLSANAHSGGNDRQIQATYKEADLQTLQEGR